VGPKGSRTFDDEKKLMNFAQFLKDLIGIFSNSESGSENTSKIFVKEPETSHPRDHILNKDYRPLGRLPSWYRSNNQNSVKLNVKANRFLSFQERRIKEAVVKRQFNKAVLI
jgi:hypothetical protein